jgi:hypothetical protein
LKIKRKFCSKNPRAALIKLIYKEHDMKSGQYVNNFELAFTNIAWVLLFVAVSVPASVARP